MSHEVQGSADRPCESRVLGKIDDVAEFVDVYRLLNAEDYAAVWVRIREWLEKYPDSADAHIIAGEATMEESDEDPATEGGEDAAFKRALGYLERAIELAPKHADAWSELAKVYFAMGRYQDSYEAAGTGVEALRFRESYLEDDYVYDNVGAQLYCTAALAAHRGGRPDLASACLDRAKQEFPDQITCIGPAEAEILRK